MNVKIGAKIKALRKRDDVTQEKLAEALGLTSQAISKWESENGYPDIEYITPVANFFNVTIDYLFDHDIEEKRKRVDEYCVQYFQYQKENLQLSYQDQIDLMRKALAEFPAEEKLLIKLASALSVKWGSQGFWMDDNGQPDIEKNKSLDCWEEAVKIMEELLTSSTDDAIRSECHRLLAPIYSLTGEKEKLQIIIDKCPPIWCCKEAVLSSALQGRGEDGIKASQEYLVGLICWLLHTLFLSGFNLDIEMRKESYIFLQNVFKFFFRDDYGLHNDALVNLHQWYALFVQETKPDEAVVALSQAFKHAKMYDEIIKKGEILYTSPYVNRIKHSNKKWTVSSAVRELLMSFTVHNYGCNHDKLNENAKYIALVAEMKDWVAKNK